jgi:hypothetical protein
LSRLQDKLGYKIGHGDIPSIEPGREGFKQALDIVRRTLENPTNVYGPISTRGGYNAIDVFSRITDFTVRIRADGTFDTLIEGATPFTK